MSFKKNTILTRRLILISIFILTSFPVFTQNIANIWVQIKNETIFVNYDLTDVNFNQDFNVSLYVSKDGGKTFIGPLKEVEGGVGKIEEEGNYTIK